MGTFTPTSGRMEGWKDIWEVAETSHTAKSGTVQSEAKDPGEIQNQGRRKSVIMSFQTFRESSKNIGGRT